MGTFKPWSLYEIMRFPCTQQSVSNASPDLVDKRKFLVDVVCGNTIHVAKLSQLLLVVTATSCGVPSSFLPTKVKVKVTCHEGPERSEIHSSTRSLTSSLDRGGWSTPSSGRFTPGNGPKATVQEAGLVRTDAEKFAPTRIRLQYGPACSESLYRLRYLGPHYLQNIA